MGTIIVDNEGEAKRWLPEGLDRDMVSRYAELVPQIVQQLTKPDYGVTNLAELKALDDDDIDEILRDLPLAKRRLIKQSLGGLKRPRQDNENEHENDQQRKRQV